MHSIKLVNFITSILVDLKYLHFLGFLKFLMLRNTTDKYLPCLTRLVILEELTRYLREQEDSL